MTMPAPPEPTASAPRRWLRRPLQGLLCRGCLAPLDAGSAAGLCGSCWAGLIPLDALRCPRCALGHNTEAPCPEPVAWEQGDAFWDYHGGRPPLGALLLPGIKAGERGWRDELLRRAFVCPLPQWAGQAQLVTAVPTAPHRHWLRGFDLATDLGRQMAGRLHIPFRATLRKRWWLHRQSERTETERRKLPRKAVTVRAKLDLTGVSILLVDDVWTTGTTLLRCAQALREAGAAEVRVLTFFRAL